MKKVVSIVLCIAMVFSFAACGGEGGGKDTEANNGGPNTEQTDKNAGTADGDGYVIALCNSSLGNTWRVQMEAEWELEAQSLKEQGIVSDYYITNADGDITQQITDMQDLITKGVDLICISAASPTSLAPVVEEAMDAGIVVCAFDNMVDTDNVSLKYYIDNVEYGEICAQYICDKLDGKGKVIALLGQLGTAAGDERKQGMENVLANYPDVEVIAEEWCDYDYATAKSAVESLLSANPEIDGVISMGGAMTQATIDAFIAADRELVPMSGEGQNGFLKIWKQYQDQGFDSCGPISPTNQGSESLRIGIRILQGESVEQDQKIEMPQVTADTLDDFLREDLSDNYWPPCELPEEKLQELYGE